MHSLIILCTSSPTLEIMWNLPVADCTSVPTTAKTPVATKISLVLAFLEHQMTKII